MERLVVAMVLVVDIIGGKFNEQCTSFVEDHF